jgi:hypothetical protein
MELSLLDKRVCIPKSKPETKRVCPLISTLREFSSSGQEMKQILNLQEKGFKKTMDAFPQTQLLL